MEAGERLATLEEKMKDLTGHNGKPGRVDKLEATQTIHARLIWIGMGGLAVLQFLQANGALNLKAVFGG